MLCKCMERMHTWDIVGNGRKCQQRARSRERVRARKRCFLEHGCREEGADGTMGEPCLHRPYAVLRIHDTQITVIREPRRVRHRARPNPRHLVGAKLVVTQSHVKKI